MQSVKSRQGTAIYTAECNHAFHFPCITAHIRKQSALVCPVYAAVWKDVPLVAIHTQQNRQQEEKIVRIDPATTPLYSPKINRRCDAMVYVDDEPLLMPKFNHIREFVVDEGEDEVEEFQGFFVNPVSSGHDAFSFNNPPQQY